MRVWNCSAALRLPTKAGLAGGCYQSGSPMGDRAIARKKEHALVSILVFVVGTLVGVVPLIFFAQRLMAPISTPP